MSGVSGRNESTANQSTRNESTPNVSTQSRGAATLEVRTIDLTATGTADDMATNASSVEVASPVDVIIDLTAPHAAPKSRASGFVTVAAAYVVAIGAAVATVVALDSALWVEVLVADLVATAVVFLASFVVRNSSMYDAYWSVAPAVVAIGLAFTGNGDVTRKALLTLVVLAWAIRLTGNWSYGWSGLHHEDWRYRKLQDDTGKAYWLVSLLGLHLFPTMMVFAGMLPFFPAYSSGRSFRVLDGVALVVGVVATALEGVADQQMHRFRRANPTGSRVMSAGLWSISRHPNYLGEILIWVSVALFGLSAAPDEKWRLVGVAVIVVLFVAISIPMIEKRHRERKGAAYDEYAANVPMLIPGIRIPRR